MKLVTVHIKNHGNLLIKMTLLQFKISDDEASRKDIKKKGTCHIYLP